MNKGSRYLPSICVVLAFFLTQCSHVVVLRPVTTADFQAFVTATGYVTDAEKFGWSVVQKTVYHFEKVHGATWKMPDGYHKAKSNFPVTQVSYNDAKAYCTWANVELPRYETYWQIAKADGRTIHINTSTISPAHQTNVVGNTWDITDGLNGSNQIRLAGGSYLCSITTCNGTNKNRQLYVSPDTGNSHISFTVLTH